MQVVGGLSGLRTLCLSCGSSDGTGAKEIARLPQLSALTLLSCPADEMACAVALAQVRLPELLFFQRTTRAQDLLRHVHSLRASARKAKLAQWALYLCTC